jgi:hypothetical protein
VLSLSARAGAAGSGGFGAHKRREQISLWAEKVREWSVVALGRESVCG